MCHLEKHMRKDIKTCYWSLKSSPPDSLEPDDSLFRGIHPTLESAAVQSSLHPGGQSYADAKLPAIGWNRPSPSGLPTRSSSTTQTPGCSTPAESASAARSSPLVPSLTPSTRASWPRSSTRPMTSSTSRCPRLGLVCPWNYSTPRMPGLLVPRASRLRSGSSASCSWRTSKNYESEATENVKRAAPVV